MTERTLRTVLIANRGEIAVRIIRCCRELGLRSVAVFSEADAEALHVRLADEARAIGPAPAALSYLDIDAVLGAAKDSRADAVHPGYGLLAEDARFAEAVGAAGLTFVGPSPDVIARMGDKVAARAVARRCGVPVVPGSGVLDPSDAAAVEAEADQVGYPLVVKASFGGGGRGMRVVREPRGLAEAVNAAGREAAASFGRSEVHLERYLERPRHVEVQILGDARGTVVHLGDRDCSVQRRHQKLIEEAPAPGVPDTLRGELAEAALRIAREVGYAGAGTVEFLVVPATGEFFFLEMNTRLQVEHGVTELVTGVDLVAAQLRIATGEPLRLGQSDIRVAGHAIQARIAAEDPREDFRPAPGRVDSLRPSLRPGVRNDFGVDVDGGDVPAAYDSMIGKVLAFAQDRDAARRRLVAALDDLRITGVPTTAAYLREVLGSPSFAADTHDTGSVAREWPPEELLGPATEPVEGDEPDGRGDEPDGRVSEHLSGPVPNVLVRTVRFDTAQGERTVAVYGPPRSNALAASPESASARTRDTSATGRAAAGDPVAPMDATVVEIRVGAGDEVEPGTVLAVLEAMKMEMEVRSGTSGTVDEVLVRVGASVSAGSPLISLT
jgi:acetyl-CoA/propionyl-CoA carboxylase biotin carboxyl carrier protein